MNDVWNRFKSCRDEQAGERLVLHYAPLVKYVADRLGQSLPAYIDQADLIGYGMPGLIAAIERFDSSWGVRFETIALTRIRASVMDELWRWMRARYRAMKLAEADLGVRNQRRPTDAEIAAELEVSVKEVRDVLRWADPPLPPMDAL